MMRLTVIFIQILALSAIGSVLVTAILLVKALFQNRLSAAWQFYIWGLLVLRLVIPYIPESPLDISSISALFSQRAEMGEQNPGNTVPDPGTLAPEAGMRVNPGEGKSPAGLTAGAGVHAGNGTAPVQERPRQLDFTLFGRIWLAGTAVFLLYMLCAYLWLYKRICRQLNPETESEINTILQECRLRMGTLPPIKIYSAEGIGTPCVFGFFRPKLLVPAEIFGSASAEEIMYMFLHEFVHVKRKDPLFHWMLLLVQAIHWFNPVIWFAFRKAKQDCELACDAGVLQCMKPEEHRKYGQTILNLIKRFHQPYSIPVTTGMVNKSQTKRRIHMISMFHKKTPAQSAAAAAIVMLAVTAAGLLAGCAVKDSKFFEDIKQSTAVGPAANQAQTDENRDKTVQDFQTLVAAGTALPEVVQFLDRSISLTSAENASLMLDTLEKAQQAFLPGLEEKFYRDEDIQKQMAKIYSSGFDLKQLDTMADGELKELLTLTRDSGFKVETAEGTFFPILHYGLYKKYGAYVTADMQEYIDIMAAESDRMPAKDAALVIGWDEVLKRALAQEKFIATRGDSIKLEAVKNLYLQYSTFVYYGANNTPLFSYDTRTMVPAAKSSYLNTVKEKGNSKLLDSLGKFLELLDKNGYRLTEEVEKYRKNATDSVSDTAGIQGEPMKPTVEVPVDIKLEENTQKSVDAGHSPWRLDPAFVAQVFASLEISPEGIQGEYPVKYEELQAVQKDGKDAVIEVGGDKATVRRVYLKRLIRQDDTGIWTVVGYDPK